MTIEPTVSDAEVAAAAEILKLYKMPAGWWTAARLALHAAARVRSAIPETEPATWEHRIRVKRHAGAGWTEWRQGHANLSATAREGLDVEERPLYTHPDLPDREGFAAGIEAAAKLIESYTPMRAAFTTEDEGGIKWEHPPQRMPIYDPSKPAADIRALALEPPIASHSKLNSFAEENAVCNCNMPPEYHADNCPARIKL